MRYIKGTKDYGLWYKKGSNFDLNNFSNVDFAGSVDDKKSTSRSAFFLGKMLVSWTSKNQNCISLSTIEVEYVATTVNYSNIIWFK